ncbi:radical SAM protein [Bacillus paramycoides]|uniref:radical SAM protein n=1 Tax=Bacillus paramycoides TaxID=2026194 RepID=UPI003D1CDD50
MYLFNSKNNEIINKITLEIFSLDTDTSLLLKKCLENKNSLDFKDEEMFLRDAFNEVGINFDLIQLWDEHFFAPQTPIVHIIKNCNSPCVMCDCWQTKGKVHHSADDLKPLFEDLALNGASSVMISGGEPTLHPELETIIDDVHRTGMTVQLNTNGILLNRKQFLYQKNIDALIVSIDGFTKEDYQLIRGTDRFEKVCENISDFHKFSPKTIIGIRVTLTKYALEKLPLLLELCKELNVDSVGFNPLDVFSKSFSRDMNEVRSNELINGLLPDIEFIDNTLIQLQDDNSHLHKMILEASSTNLFSWDITRFIQCLEYYKQIILKNKIGDSAPCNFPYFSLVVDYDGKIKPCFYAEAYSSIKDFSSKNWNVEEIVKDLKESGRCDGCRGKVFCG